MVLCKCLFTEANSANTYFLARNITHLIGVFSSWQEWLILCCCVSLKLPKWKGVYLFLIMSLGNLNWSFLFGMVRPYFSYFWMNLFKAIWVHPSWMPSAHLSWTGERKYNERLLGQDKGRERSFTRFLSQAKRTWLREINFIYYLSSQSKEMRNKLKS